MRTIMLGASWCLVVGGITLSTLAAFVAPEIDTAPLNRLSIIGLAGVLVWGRP